MLNLPAGHYSGAWLNVKTGSIERSEDIDATGEDTVSDIGCAGGSGKPCYVIREVEGG
jgi:hypothetical protein